MFSIMLFIFLCFLGMLAVLFHMLRSQERLCQVLRDEHAQMRVLLRAMESRLDALDGSAGSEPRPAGTLPARDPLLHLSFEDPVSSARTDRLGRIRPWTCILIRLRTRAPIPWAAAESLRRMCVTR